MAITIRAVFDGTGLRPEEPVDLRTDVTYVITIEEETTIDNDSSSSEEHPLTLLGRLAVDMGIDDFAENHDWYAHGRISDDSEDQ